MPILQDLYPNLPGHLVELKDGGLALQPDPNPPQTKSVLILGTAVDGPVNQPVSVPDPLTAEVVFGRATPGATLMLAAEEAYRAGCRDIRLMRISGQRAAVRLKAKEQSVATTRIAREDLGSAAGNKETSFTLANAPVVDGSVEVLANGKALPATAFTVDLTGGTVTLNANVCDSEAAITISYSYTVDSQTYSATENSAAGVPFIAHGDPQVLALSQTPLAGSVVLMAAGVEITPDKYTIDSAAKTVTLQPGTADLGAALSISYSYQEVKIVAPELVIQSVYGGRVYNDGTVKVEEIRAADDSIIGMQVSITKPMIKRSSRTEAARVYRSLDYPTLGAMADAITRDTNLAIYQASTANPTTPSTDLLPLTETQFTGGDDELDLSKEELYARLGGQRDETGAVVKAGAYQLLENYDVDYIVPAGVYADDELLDPRDNFALQLATACAIISHRNTMTQGVIATSSPVEPGLEAVEAHVQYLLGKPNDFFMRDRQGEIILDVEGNKIDLGGFITVLAGPDQVYTNSRLGVYAANSAAALAGFYSTLLPSNGPTNADFPVSSLRFNYSNGQRNRLGGARYVNLFVKGNRVVLQDGVTAAQPNSDYSRWTSFEAVRNAVNAINEVVDPYLGKAPTVNNQNALMNAVTKRLDAMREAGDLRNYSIRFVITPNDMILGKGRFELTVVPPFELRQITTVVNLRASL